MSDDTCGAEGKLSEEALALLRTLPACVCPDTHEDLVDSLRCPLRAGHEGTHHALVREVRIGNLRGAWACWEEGQASAGLLLHPDCTAPDPDNPDASCALFAGHAGSHRRMPDQDESRQRPQLGLVPRQPGTAR